MFESILDIEEICKRGHPFADVKHVIPAVLTGIFGSSGRVMFRTMFGFDFSVEKADCELVVGGRPTGFVVERFDPERRIRVEDRSAGWCPIVVDHSDTLELRGKPSASWRLEVHLLPVNDAGPDAVPSALGAIDCNPFVDERKL